MQWFVFYENINKKEIQRFDIFNHGGFRSDFCKAVKKNKDKDEFAEEIRHSLMYYFWCRSEYEVLIYPWPTRSVEDVHIKIDIFEQVNMNYQAFIDYAWEHRKEVEPW